MSRSYSVLKPAEFFGAWNRDDDHPHDRLFGGELSELETADGYDPDDAAQLIAPDSPNSPRLYASNYRVVLLKHLSYPHLFGSCY